MRSRPATHRVAQSQGSSREASPDRQRFGFGAANSVIHRQSELEAAVADALVSENTVMKPTFMKIKIRPTFMKSVSLNSCLAVLVSNEQSVLLIGNILGTIVTCYYLSHD